MSLAASYKQRVELGELAHDLAQEAALKHLDAFVTRYQNKSKPKLFSRKKNQTKGVYLYGGIGRGKTMLMDMLAASLAGPRTRRVHFHAFMLEIHARLKAVRDQDKDVNDFLGTVAQDIAQDTDLLCFDEVHVNDIADAMILGPLFAAFFKLGMGIVATSNYAPDNLYHDGLQRSRFLPFIDLIKKNMDVVHLDSQTDYRLRALSEKGTWLYPLNEQSAGAMRALFETLTDHQKTNPAAIDVEGRVLPLLQADTHCAWAAFDTLCFEARGAIDYLTLGHAFETIFVDNVPDMHEDNKNQARRFMTLVDTLYDLGRVLVVRAAAKPQDIYDGSTHAFEFQRTVSRLLEMQSPQWLAKAQKTRNAA